MLPHEPSLPEDLGHAWEAVRADWQSEARHAAFIELCAQQRRLPDAGALYRGVKEREPERAEQAERQLQRIMARALVMLAQQAPQPVAPNARRVVMLLAVVVAGLLMGSAIFAATRLVSVGGN
jgi:hypothetical protein